MATQSLTHSQNSMPSQRPQSTVGFRRPDAVSVTEATSYARMLMGCFPQKDVGDVKVFAAGLVQVMSDYPAYVLADVVCPRGGLPVSSPFMPALSEVKRACEEASSRHAMARREAEQRRKAQAERAAANPCDPARAEAILKSVADELRRRNAAAAGLGQPAA